MVGKQNVHIWKTKSFFSARHDLWWFFFHKIYLLSFAAINVLKKLMFAKMIRTEM